MSPFVTVAIWGLFPHGDNVRELELTVVYGMKIIEVLKAVMSVNEKVFHLDNLAGNIKSGLLADLLIVAGDPSMTISDFRQ